MQANLPAAKLCGVADNLSQIARLLWCHNQQEPVRALSFGTIDLGRAEGPQQAAIESAPEKVNVDDDPEAGVVCP